MCFLELLRNDNDLFNSTSTLLPCRCLNRSRSSPAISQLKPLLKHFRRLSSPCPSIPSIMTVQTIDSGLNTSTVCTTSRSPTPELDEDKTSMIFEIDSIFNRTITKENKSHSFKQKEKKMNSKSNRSFFIRSDRVKRVLKRYLIDNIFYDK